MVGKFSIAAVLLPIVLLNNITLRADQLSVDAERQSLLRLKAAEVQRLKNVALDISQKENERWLALQRLAALGSDESVRILEALYDGVPGIQQPWDKVDIVRFLGET